MNRWIASQGFWFQLRHSFVGGSTGRVVFQLVKMSVRLVVFLFLAAAAAFIYLQWRTNSEQFHNLIKREVAESLAASELDARGIQRQQGKLVIGRMAAEGGNGTFFNALEARNVHMKMGLADGLFQSWTPQQVSISRLDLDLRAGAADEAGARGIAEVLFPEDGGSNVATIEIWDVTLRWGTAAATRGSIEHSRVNIRRSDQMLRMTFTGGHFSQNWLRDLEIKNLVVICTPEGFRFERAEFEKDGTKVDMTDLRLKAGASPTVDGICRISGYAIGDVLPEPLPEFIDGSISGDFKISGSPNQSEGIAFDGTVALDKNAVIIFRERIPLLQALSVVDGMRSYKRLEFRDGSFQMKTSGSGIWLDHVNVRSGDVFHLTGSLRVRNPTEEELTSVRADSGAGILGSTEGGGLIANPKMAAEFALVETVANRDGMADQGETLFDRITGRMEFQRQQRAASRRLEQMLRYEGAFDISLPADAFERAELLREKYPPDVSTGRVRLKVPVEGFLYELTLSQSEELYLQGKR
ncbi:MAG: hypothetical protein V4733_07275 [Verrucomicrobiota bacterium]